ncbi:response regulator transcription factor [Sulfurimonas sp. SWIR-19]|uniref:response regulator transcription factor n=1 Tax=Sulfurimonas sp. SWIR-19 TaxID=2878390 RepID=UPI001CF43226|nr:response regulator transcription factor [Sulfurimonas sp. SWIR-19]UCM99463.1 response regulator transcription factor [Sulfurimonas sp. SWIR-19]
MKILLLEDEIMLNESIQEYLQEQGHIVVSFTDGLEAFENLQKDDYDLLILDISVPNIDGLTLLEKLHAIKIHTPSIYISALVDIEDISRAYDLGCYDYLKKPFHLKELALKIDRILTDKDIPLVFLRLSKNYMYDQENNMLLFQNTPQILTKKQSQIIDILARNRSRIVDFEQFRMYVWDEQIVDNATIRAEINRLKKVLHEDIIVNVRGMGYMIEK